MNFKKNEILLNDGNETNSRTLYEKYCEIFNFDKSAATNFGRQGALLYAYDVTPEHYSFICLTYYNFSLTESYSNTTKWENCIMDNGTVIIETWNKEIFNKENNQMKKYLDLFYANPNDIRITFIKRQIGGRMVYSFLGVFQCVDINTEKRTRTYKKISDKYPI